VPLKEWIILGAGFAFCFVAGLGFGLIVTNPTADSTAPFVPLTKMSATAPEPDPVTMPSETPTPTPTPYTGEVLAYGDSMTRSSSWPRTASSIAVSRSTPRNPGRWDPDQMNSRHTGPIFPIDC
jgi:hypothetical protein